MMKKLCLLFIFTFVLFSSSVNAKSITSLDADIKNGEISVSGVAEEGTLAVQIVVYDEKEENVIAMQSTEVDNDNKFSDKIVVADGKYVVKAADYEGGEFVSANVPKETNSESTPNTGDNIVKYVIIGGIAIIGLIGTVVYFKKKVNN